MDLGRARQQLDGDPDALRHTLDEAIGQTRETLDELRALARGIAPPVLTDRGLPSALAAVAARCTVPVELAVDAELGMSGGRLNPVVENTAYFTVAEALTNVARHAEVQEVNVELKADTKYLRVQIEDLGHGFDPDLAPVGHSTGLTGMKERALLIGGQLTIESSPSSGTRILVELPLRGTVTKWNEL